MKAALAAKVEAWPGTDGALDVLVMDGIEAVRLERVSETCYLLAIEAEDGEVIVQFRSCGAKPCKAVILPGD